ncbi:MAG: GNAT family N-acetyltransferase [Clostridia bacterium]|nr:GNAT family N-acetyltransferase [Clostridia bacterium]
MEYSLIGAANTDALWELQKLYKREIGEDTPSDDAKSRLKAAIEAKSILFFGVWDGEVLAGCCSITVGFSTFDYAKSGVFEDFYIRPKYRHMGIARALVRFACAASGVSTLTVGCASCDVDMYKALGFSIEIGSLLAFE